jgi:hypothetical protein
MRHAGVVVMLAALVLTACGTTQEGGSVDTNTPDGTAAVTPATSELTITVRSSESAAPRTWTLRCDPIGGNHPDATAACAAIERARNPFAPVPKDMACTQIYGGPQTATIVGTWKGERVNAAYKRTDGCEIARWQQLATVFQANTGINPT